MGKTAYRKQLRAEAGVRRPFPITSPNPFAPVFMHSLVRYLDGVHNLGPIDQAFRRALDANPDFAHRDLRIVREAWESLPAADRERATPPELRNLDTAQAITENDLRPVMQRLATESRIAGVVLLHPASGNAVSLAPGALQPHDAVPQATLGRVLEVTLAAPFGVQPLLPVPIITQLLPRDPENVCAVRPGRIMTIVGENLPASPPWSLGACTVEFYREADVAAIEPPNAPQPAGGEVTGHIGALWFPTATTHPIASSNTEMKVVVPPLARGHYVVKVTVYYAGGVRTSNGQRASVGAPLRNDPLTLHRAAPEAQVPGGSIQLKGEGFEANMYIAAVLTPRNAEWNGPCILPAFYVNATTLQLPLPQTLRPGHYDLTITTNGSPESAKVAFTVQVPQYVLQFTKMICEDESDAECVGDDEIATFWMVSADGVTWKKNTDTYDGFSDGTRRDYLAGQGNAFQVDGNPGAVGTYLCVVTQLMEIDAGDAQLASECLSTVGDFVGDIGDIFGGLVSLIGTCVKYVLKLVGWLIELFGGEPDDLGIMELAWTYADLQMMTDNSHRRAEGELAFANADSTGSYRLRYQLLRCV